ncbi:hypothetical protein WICPIJ_004085, partial [Wickerhamomyces pijperi]
TSAVSSVGAVPWIWFSIALRLYAPVASLFLWFPDVEDLLLAVLVAAEPGSSNAELGRLALDFTLIDDVK